MSNTYDHVVTILRFAVAGFWLFLFLTDAPLISIILSFLALGILTVIATKRALRRQSEKTIVYWDTWDDFVEDNWEFLFNTPQEDGETEKKP